MTRTISVVLVTFVVLVGIMSPVTLAQFKQMSFSLNIAAPIFNPFAIGTDRVGFTYASFFYVADGTQTGTRQISQVVDFAIPGPLGYVYYTRYSEWNYFNPQTNAITNIFTGPPAHYSYYGNPLFSTSKKTYARWSIYINAMFWSYDPVANNTGEIKTERSYNYANIYALESVLYKDELVVRYDLKPPYAANTNDSGLPTNLYAAPHLGYLYFAYTRNSKTGWTTGNELWRTDLNSYKMVADINAGPGSSNPRYFCDVAGVGLFFFANPTKNTTKVSLYWSDGSSKFKRMSRHEISDFLTNKIPIVSVGNHAVYIVNNMLWTTDGTAAGTAPLMKVTSSDLATTQRLAYFVSSSANHGVELYQTDGTPAGTTRVPYETISGAGSSQPQDLATTESGDLLFTAFTSNGSREVFKYTPTA